MLPSIFVIPNEFSFIVEVINASYYYISNYFFMYFETFVIKLRLTDSAKLTFVNEDVLPPLPFCYRYMSVESLNI